MKWLSLLICAFVLLPGCCGRSSNSGTDPFYGYTRVPPPGTGSIYGQSTDPYYRGTPNSAPNSTAPLFDQPKAPAPKTLPANPGTMAPVNPGAAPSDGNRYLPPGRSFNYQGQIGSPGSGSATRVRPPSYANRQSTADAVPHLADRGTKPADRTAGNVTSRNPIIQVVPPRPKATTISNSAGTRANGVSIQPRRSTPRGQAVDIMDLPDASSSTGPDRSTAKRQENGFRLVSATEDAPGRGKVVAAATSCDSNVGLATRGKYGHDPEYRRLRGKLEHSQVDGCWKLRYIPIDGATDDFGGSVVLTDVSLLTGIERGDFVEIRGKIGPRDAAHDAATHGFAPTYLATEIVKIPH